MPCLQVFLPPDFKPAQLEESDLWRVAKFSQSEVQQSVPRHMSRGHVDMAGEMVNVAESCVGVPHLRRVRRGGWKDH